LKPLRGRGLVAMSLITVGLGLILRDVVFLVAGPQIRQYAIDQTAVLDLRLVRLSPGQAVAIAVTAVIAPAVPRVLSRTGGALAAGVVLGLAMELSTWSGLLGGLEARYKPVLAFAVLILLLLYRPQGLFGKARVL